MSTNARGEKKVAPLKPSSERRGERRAMDTLKHLDVEHLDDFDEAELPTFVPRVHKRTLKG